MRHRHAISDADWERIKHLLPGQPGQHGKVAKDNRLFLDAVLWIAKTGAPWRDLPDRFGNWNSAWRRVARTTGSFGAQSHERSPGDAWPDHPASLNPRPLAS